MELRTSTRRLLLSCIVLVLVGCSSSYEPAVEPAGDTPEATLPPVGVGASASAVLGAAGGTLDLGSLTLVVPEGALSEDNEIRVTAMDAEVPEGFTAYSPIFRFEPEGTTFARPLSVSLPFEGASELATIFWTNRGGDSFGALDTEVEGGRAIAETTHFSRAFVGTACAGEECCRRAQGSLDVLMLVDSSNSMEEEQAALTAELPRIVEALATGDVDLDGEQDFPAVRSLQIGTISPDMGSGSYAVPTCGVGSGDDGVLQTAGSAEIAGCAAAYPSVHRFEEGEDVTDFAQSVSCVANLGTGGCGFEQQLESMLKAITPSSSATTFAGTSPGHGDGANAGLVRDDAMLAVVMLTDENDCSVLDPDLLNPTSGRYGSDLNLRCFQFPDALHPVERYAEGLLDLKADPASVIFASIAGIPPELEGAPLAGILDDPRMEETVDPAQPTRLLPSCDVPGVGLAYPPRRILEATQALEERGGAGVAASICQRDFGGAVDAILRRVSARISGRCG